MYALFGGVSLKVAVVVVVVVVVINGGGEDQLLAQGLIKRELFPYASKKSLKWAHRRELLLQELRVRQPDIACLQEVDSYAQFYRFEFQKLDYDCFYHQNLGKSHGCCIIWKKSKFKKLACESIDFDDESWLRRTTRSRSNGQLVALGNLERTGGVIITNHHLIWTPTAHYEKSRQAYIMLRRAWEKRGIWGFPVFCCGDFNAVPQEPTYHLLTKRPLPDQLKKGLARIPLKQLQEMKDESLIDQIWETPEENPFPQHLASPDILIELFGQLPRCVSAYENYADLDPQHSSVPEQGSEQGSKQSSEQGSEQSSEKDLKEPKWTTYTVWKGTLDYIFSVVEDDSKDEEDRTEPRLHQLLKLPEETRLRPGLPNENFGSDHLCLMAEYFID